MTTEQTPVLEEDQNVETGPKGLRDALERSKGQVAEKDTENTVLKSQLMQMVVEKLGLDIEQGPGKAVADFYDGEPDAEKVAEFAQKYGWTPPEPASVAPIVREAQQRVTAATAGGVSPEPTERADEIRAAEAAGDWPQAIKLKLGAFVETQT